GRGFENVSGSTLGNEEARVRAIVAREHTGRRVSAIKAELGATMDGQVAVFRDADGIQGALDNVRRLKEEAKGAWIDDRGTIFNQDVLGALELENMLDCAETTCMAALERKESRGAQFRTDFPERNDADWLKHIDVSLNGDEPEIGYSPVTITDWQPQERTY
ncbi:MAG: succinate dehydrogenase/fumarate reductase flavoprotein subunit, partial [Solirubrobacterales bacterium]